MYSYSLGYGCLIWFRIYNKRNFCRLICKCEYLKSIYIYKLNEYKFPNVKY